MCLSRITKTNPFHGNKEVIAYKILTKNGGWDSQYLKVKSGLAPMWWGQGNRSYKIGPEFYKCHNPKERIRTKNGRYLAGFHCFQTLHGAISNCGKDSAVFKVTLRKVTASGPDWGKACYVAQEMRLDKLMYSFTVKHHTVVTRTVYKNGKVTTTTEERNR
jgi:hypothetical protein